MAGERSMSRKPALAFGAVIAIGAVGAFAAGGRAPDDDRAADRAAIVKSGQDFVQAFNKRDAKAIAAQWTESGEMEEETGRFVRGRQAIEKAYAEFFKNKPGATAELRVESVRFLARDMAVEDGLMLVGSNGKEMPGSSWYRAIHVRDAGNWKIAYSREWGGDFDRVADIEWLVGTWQGGPKGDEVTITYAKDKDKPGLHGTYSTKADGKVVTSGTFRIAFDPQRGQLHSWNFDDLGGHGQALWIRDGDRWVMDSIGVLPDGTDTASVNILHRINKNEIAWQSIDRVAGGMQVGGGLLLPDTQPIRLKRVQ